MKYILLALLLLPVVSAYTLEEYTALSNAQLVQNINATYERWSADKINQNWHYNIYTPAQIRNTIVYAPEEVKASIPREHIRLCLRQFTAATCYNTVVLNTSPYMFRGEQYTSVYLQIQRQRLYAYYRAKELQRTIEAESNEDLTFNNGRTPPTPTENIE